VQPWDGMLKHYALGPRRPHLLALRRGLIADMATPYLGHPPRGPGAADAAAALAAAAAQLAACNTSQGEGGEASGLEGAEPGRLHAEAAAAITQGARFQWDWGQLVNTRPPPPTTAAAAGAAGKKEA
jgi:hypothetical protein